MRYILEIVFLLVTTTAALSDEKIDISVLKPCKKSEDCHPWQVCATCTTPVLWGFMGAHMTKGWCSDVTDTGICEYDDGEISCHCNEKEENDPKRKVLLSLGSEVPQLFCRDDSVCREYIPNSRCSHCAYATDVHQITVILNACTKAPEDDPYSYCDKSQLYMCSCGQRLPAPPVKQRLRPSTPQSKNPQQVIITAANPPDLTGAERVDLSAWGKQAILGGSGGYDDGNDGGSLPAAAGLFDSSTWTQNMVGPTSGEGEDIWTGDGYDSFNT